MWLKDPMIVSLRWILAKKIMEGMNKVKVAPDATSDRPRTRVASARLSAQQEPLVGRQEGNSSLSPYYGEGTSQPNFSYHDYGDD